MKSLEEKIYMTEGAYATSYKEIENEVFNKVSALFEEDCDDLSIDISGDNVVVTIYDHFTGEPVDMRVNQVVFKRGVKKMFIKGVSVGMDGKCEVSDVPVWQQGFILLPLVRKIERIEAEKKTALKPHTSIIVSVNIEYEGDLTDDELERKLENFPRVFKDDDGKDIHLDIDEWDISDKRYRTF